MKDLLNASRSVNSVNEEKNIDIQLKRNERLLPYDSVSDSMDLYNLYSRERDISTKYRLIFDVNTIASNVLFNSLTEVVKDEGSDNCTRPMTAPTAATSTANFSTVQAIRDTEYSHKDLGPYVYHCGIDIFNNHMLRCNGFVHIQKPLESDTLSRGVFNTIRDYRRTYNGAIVSEAKPYTNSTSTSGSYIHVYQQDNILSLKDAYLSRINEKDGWVGFNNPTNISIPNGVFGQTFNKLLNNNIGGEFIDMYPDRSLFSFIPKYNKYRNREEPNWDYCITYPYKSDYNYFNKVNGSVFDIPIKDQDRGIAITSTAETATVSGVRLIEFHSLINHNLKDGDTIKFFVGEDAIAAKGTFNVARVGNADGDDTKHIFAIFKGDIDNNDTMKGKVFNAISFKKCSGGSLCKYYFRKFKKIEGIKSTLGKMAYGINIYGDREAQIVFQDTIDTYGLVDNLGREVKELYLTTIKNNKGFKTWYDDGQYGSSAVTYSHCFGKVTSGIDMADVESPYNVRKLHNIDNSSISAYRDGNRKVMGVLSPVTGLTESCKNLADYSISGIVESNMDEFYGDIVEFDPANFKETVIENVYHRFNTAQRETNNITYANIIYDNLVADDYEVSGSSYTTFTVNEETYNRIDENGRTCYYQANLQPEGYFYNPHHQIRLLNESRNISTFNATRLTIMSHEPWLKSDFSVEFNDYITTIIVTSDYGFIKGDQIAFIDKRDASIIWGRLESCEKIEDGVMLRVLTSKKVNPSIHSSGNLILALTDGSVPLYAVYDINDELFRWRDLMPMSELDTTDPMYNRPFSNGCHYIESNVNLYVRRQDPHGDFGLLYPGETRGAIVDRSRIDELKFRGIKIDLSSIAFNAIKDLTTSCLYE